MNVEAVEREKYNEMWQVPAYATFSPGASYVDLFLDMAQPAPAASIVDLGCGTGRAGVALRERGYAVTLCDLTRTGLVEDARGLPFVTACMWNDLAQPVGFADWVYCCDVMEHVPTEYTMLAITRMLAIARKGVFLSICTEHDTWGTWIGQTLHQTVRPFTWWRDRLREAGTLAECRDLQHCGLYLVTP